MEHLALKTICKSFQIYQQQLHQLEGRGILPDRPYRVVTPEYVLALAKWHEGARGHLPTAAKELVEKAENTLHAVSV